MIPQGEFHAILKAVAHSAGVKDDRENLNAILFEFLEDGTRIVSTDGRRVTVATLNFIVPPVVVGSFLAPIADIKELLGIFRHKSDKRVSFAVQGDTLMVTNGKASLNVERLDMDFPDYRQVLPSDDTGAGGVVRFRLKYLAQALKACDGLIGPADGVDVITRAVGAMPPSTLRPVLDPSLEVLQSLDIYIMPMKRD